ncbi:IclR family transcriptional regulator [Deinococcus saxicola]
MERLARGTHLLAFLCVLHSPPGQQGQVLCVARSVQGRDGPPVAGELDFELPPHATASGKLLLALAGQPLPHSTKAFTPHTLTAPAAWDAEAQAIRTQGHALSQDEWALGTSGLAVPLRGEGGMVLAALGLSLPTARMSARESLLRALHMAASEVGWTLGYRGEK